MRFGCALGAVALSDSSSRYKWIESPFPGTASDFSAELPSSRLGRYTNRRQNCTRFACASQRSWQIMDCYYYHWFVAVIT